jgi:hypothetical protein
MKVHVEADPRTDALYWYSDDKKFYGPIVKPFALDDRQGYYEEFPAGALLSVPDARPGDRPTFNGNSPLIMQAPTVEELIPKLEAWVDENAGKRLWDLRRND